MCLNRCSSSCTDHTYKITVRSKRLFDQSQDAIFVHLDNVIWSGLGWNVLNIDKSLFLRPARYVCMALYGMALYLYGATWHCILCYAIAWDDITSTTTLRYDKVRYGLVRCSICVLVRKFECGAV